MEESDDLDTEGLLHPRRELDDQLQAQTEGQNGQIGLVVLRVCPPDTRDGFEDRSTRGRIRVDAILPGHEGPVEDGRVEQERQRRGQGQDDGEGDDPVVSPPFGVDPLLPIIRDVEIGEHEAHPVAGRPALARIF